MKPMTIKEPLNLTPIPKARVWGGQALSRCLGLNFDLPGPTGEIWSIVDRDDCSSLIAGGRFAGCSLRGLMLSHRDDILGRSQSTPESAFPFIIKYIDTDQNLSVQVHPDAQGAQLVGEGAESKDEFWYVLSARMGARIFFGLKSGVGAAEFTSSAGGPSIVETLDEYPVRGGDCIYVPAGIVHSIGAGITLVEVQKNSDTTFRIYDWGRMGMNGHPRVCHIEKALQVIDFKTHVRGPYQQKSRQVGMNLHSTLLATGDFGVELLSIDAPLQHETADQAWALVVLAGSVRLTAMEVNVEWELHRGDTWLIPASLGKYRLHSPVGDVKIIRVEAKP
ncbi:MAG: mannose-6-phosphate isomerase [Glaciecola sp.]|jgi:mannose-6-phosphate isomerase